MLRWLMSLALLVMSVAAWANDPVNANRQGVLLDGYDLVAYFESNEAERGKPEHSTVYQGVTLFFASNQRREQFLASPQHYWPQYHGHCANGLSDGHLVRANPEIFRIIDGRLYLFYSWWGKAQWKFDQPEQIKLANDYWERFRSSY